MPNHLPYGKIPSARPLLLSVVLAAGLSGFMFAGSAEAAQFTVYKSPWCGCCSNWVDQLKAKGHDVVTKDVENLDAIKKLAGVPGDLQACHTASVEGYVVEGHVPVKEIDRLLSERPTARGIAVPGMPGGSLGMEGADPESYNVMLFKADGTTSVYAKY